MTKYLRHKIDGEIFRWSPALASHPLLEEVTEEQAYPARFAQPEVAKRINTEPKVVVSVPEEVYVAQPVNDRELEAQATAAAARKTTGVRTRQPKTTTAVDTSAFAGLKESL